MHVAIAFVVALIAILFIVIIAGASPFIGIPILWSPSGWRRSMR